MIDSESMAKIEALAEQAAAQNSVQIYDVEFIPHGRILRVSIDRDGGVGIEDCANVSRDLGTALDESPVLEDINYNLEVSSPGLERKLKRPWHFQKAVGKKIQVRLSEALAQFGIQNERLKATKQLSEVALVAADEKSAQLEIEKEVVHIPFESFEKAQVVFELSKGEKKGPGKQPKGKK
ncbi:MAG: ribosome maturation factor RimP [Proteobacteria bacterium]|jgi:ribosome maturation factor RimP|nr:ribosome maturation factor RimP [Pseudomonadota bacterium]